MNSACAPRRGVSLSSGLALAGLERILLRRALHTV
jgi:hypothetical protein